MEKKTRIPTQKRALDKFNKIIEAATKLFNEKGYYNITTADISKEADVATGSVYAYFKDKKEIYMKVIENINEKFNYPTRDFWIENINKDFRNPKVAKEVFSIFIKLMIEQHNFSKTFHDEMDALALLDEDIANVRKEQEKRRYEKTKEIFKTIDIPFKNEEEEDVFTHYSFLLIEDVCHKILYDDTITNIDLCIEKCSIMLYALFESATDFNNRK